MTTKKKTSHRDDAVEATSFLEEITGGPLTFAEMLVSTREGEGMSQSAFAKKLGISRANLCDIEKGRKSVSVRRAAHFAQVLGYSPEFWVAMALQDQLNMAGLRMRVSVDAA